MGIVIPWLPGATAQLFCNIGVVEATAAMTNPLTVHPVGRRAFALAAIFLRALDSAIQHASVHDARPAGLAAARGWQQAEAAHAHRWQ